jgi:molybdenum cofactor biosynthesis protein B
MVDYEPASEDWGGLPKMTEKVASDDGAPAAGKGSNEHGARRALGARCAVLTISDSRSFETDQSGRSIGDLLKGEGHVVCHYGIVRNDPSTLQREISCLLEAELDLIVTTGGTGISRRDCTIETIEPLLEKKLGGFGELFRYLSYREIGSRAFMSRASAGVVKGKLLFALPGSTHAVQLAVRELILPELGHLIWEANR